MEPIQFETEAQSDHTIRVPDGIKLPSGSLNVTIVPAQSPNTDEIPGTWQWLQEMAKEAERINPDLPADMSAHHDYYAHGKPRE
jgi:hypothetical protein